MSVSTKLPSSAAIYARTSSPNQRFNYSIEEQIRECWKFCDQRGWTVQFVFADESQGGSSIDRPKFQTMLQRAESRDFEVITFWKLDRFCRSLADLVNVERVLRGWGVELCSATEFIDTTSSIGRFNYRTLASVAELEREQIGERARLGLYGRARQQKWPNAHPPLGYAIGEDGRLLVEPTCAELVKGIFRMYLEAESTPEVAFRLNKEGLRNSKSRWNARAVRDILINRIYVGIYHVAGFEEYNERYRIVSNDIFEKTNETLTRFEGDCASRPSTPRDRKVAGINMVQDRFGEFLDSLPSEILR